MAVGVPIGPDFDWNAYRLNGGSTTPLPGSPNWNAQFQQQMAQIQRQFATPQAPTQRYWNGQEWIAGANPNAGNTSGGYQSPDSGRGGAASGGYNMQYSQGGPMPGEDPRLTQAIAQLQGQAALSDSAINDQAAQAMAAQRSVMQREAEKQLQQTLSSRGLLPGGGNVNRLRAEIETPMNEKLAAFQESVRQNLTGQRSANLQNQTSNLTTLQGQKNQAAMDQQRLAMQAQLDQQRMAMDQQRFQMENAARAQENAFRMAMSQAEMQQRMQEQAMAASRAPSGYNQGRGNGYAGGNGYEEAGALRGGGGGGATVMGGLDYGEGMRQNYQNQVAQERLRSGLNAQGGYDPSRVTYTPSPRGAYDAAQRAGGQQGVTAPLAYTFTGGTGNGLSSSGSTMASLYQPTQQYYIT